VIPIGSSDSRRERSDVRIRAIGRWGRGRGASSNGGRFFCVPGVGVDGRRLDDVHTTLGLASVSAAGFLLGDSRSDSRVTVSGGCGVV
jgi:hypothetical protein